MKLASAPQDLAVCFFFSYAKHVFLRSFSPQPHPSFLPSFSLSLFIVRTMLGFVQIYFFLTSITLWTNASEILLENDGRVATAVFGTVASGHLNEITDVGNDFFSLESSIEESATNHSPKNITQFLLGLEQSGYDSRIRPRLGSTPVVVTCSFFVNTISRISESNMDYTTDFYFRQTWTDNRLRWDDDDHEDETDKIEDSITLSGNYFFSDIWRPDTFFVNEKTSSFHYVTGLNSFLRIMPDGHVTQSIRITLRATCHMHFLYFPMDHQRCSLLIESYSQPSSEILYRWRNKHSEHSTAPSHAVVFSQGASSMLHFVVHGYRAIEVSTLREDGFNHSRLIFDIYVARNLGFYLIQVYIPACLIVIISWISFWLPRNIHPARITLGVTTVLTMVTFINYGSKSGLPNISYLKAMDIYLMFCFVMVFFALLEFPVVSYTTKKLFNCPLYRKQRKIQADFFIDNDLTNFSISNNDDILQSDEDDVADFDDDENDDDDEDDDDDDAGGSDGSKCHCSIPHWLPSKIEVFSRLVFPVGFGVFNYFYWNYYLNTHLSNMETDEGFIDFNLH